MNALMNWMEQHLVPIANRFAQNPILKTMSEGAMSLLAVIMVGSIFSILNGIPWEPYTNFLNSTHLNEFFAFIPAITTELLGLYMAFSVGRAGAKNFGQPESAFMCGILSMACYLVLVPIDSVEGVSSIQTKYLGTQGIFVALIGGILSSSIVTWIIQKKIVIKMPSGVPPMVGENFAALIPGFVIITLFALIKWIFLLTPYGNPIDCIYSIIQTPLQALTSSLPAFLLLILIASDPLVLRCSWFIFCVADSVSFVDRICWRKHSQCSCWTSNRTYLECGHVGSGLSRRSGSYDWTSDLALFLFEICTI
jgi:PTS system cellobiose-specific IIC component